MRTMILILLLFTSFLEAQTPDKGEVTYLDFNQKPTSKDNASYYEFKTPYKEDIIKYQKYFIFSVTKAFLVEKYYLDKEGRKQGKYKSYFKDGVIKKEGIYKDDLKFGAWKNYIKTSFKRTDSIENLTYLQRVEYYKNNKRNGNFKFFHEDGSIQGEGQYKNDNFFGECYWYHLNRQMSSLETYNEKGKIKKIQQWDEDGVEKNKKPKANHELTESKKYLHYKISKELSNKMSVNIYNKHLNQYGKVYVQILLEKSGKIFVIKTKSSSGLSLGYENEIKRVLENMPIQKPFNFHNQLLNVVFTIPIKIYPKPNNFEN